MTRGIETKLCWGVISPAQFDFSCNFEKCRWISIESLLDNKQWPTQRLETLTIAVMKLYTSFLHFTE